MPARKEIPLIFHDFGRPRYEQRGLATGCIYWTFDYIMIYNEIRLGKATSFKEAEARVILFSVMKVIRISCN